MPNINRNRDPKICELCGLSIPIPDRIICYECAAILGAEDWILVAEIVEKQDAN